GIVGVGQARGRLGYAMGHLVAGHVDRHDRPPARGAQAIGHELVRRAVPRGVAAGGRALAAERHVDDALDAHAVVVDAVAAEDVLVEVPGGGDTEVRVGGFRLDAGLGVVAPVVVRV